MMSLFLLINARRDSVTIFLLSQDVGLERIRNKPILLEVAKFLSQLIAFSSFVR